MGAGVAAGPHCPSAGTWPGRQGVPHRAVSSDGARTGGSRYRFLRGPFPAEAGAGFPAGSPTRAEALAVRRSAVRNSRPSSPHRGPSAEALVPLMAGSSAEASVPPDGPWAETLGPPVSQLPGRSPVLPGNSGAEAPSFPVAAQGPKSRFPPGWSWTRRSGVPPEDFPPARRPAGNLMGASRSLPLSHPLKGKPAASASRRLRQPPCLRFRPPCRPKATGPISARAVAGKAFPRCREIVSATSESCHEKRFGPSLIRLWITRITGVKAGPDARPRHPCPARAGRIKEAPIFPS